MIKKCLACPLPVIPGEEYCPIHTTENIPTVMPKALNAYQKFIAQGGKETEWEAYRQAQNTKLRTEAISHIKQQWQSGQELSGNSVVNILRAEEIKIPPDIVRALDDDSTVVSLTSVTGRGMGRSEAKRIHSVVSKAMAKVVPKTSGAPLRLKANERRRYEVYYIKPNDNVPYLEDTVNTLSEAVNLINKLKLQKRGHFDIRSVVERWEPDPRPWDKKRIKWEMVDPIGRLYEEIFYDERGKLLG